MSPRRTLEETKTAISLPLRRSLSPPDMDDSIDSVENDEEEPELYRQLKALWVAANMQARKWISNSPEVMEKIPAEDRATEIVIGSGQDPITKTLGISWNSTKEEFTVTASPVSPGFQTTKRNILRKIATIFDPLGFVCPYVAVVKILLQELWMRGYGWDDEVQDQIANRGLVRALKTYAYIYHIHALVFLLSSTLPTDVQDYCAVYIYIYVYIFIYEITKINVTNYHKHT